MLMIRQERIVREWSQGFVARQIGVTQAMFQKIETGQRKPSFAVLVKLEDLFEMDYRELFCLPRRQPKDTQSDPVGKQG